MVAPVPLSHRRAPVRLAGNAVNRFLGGLAALGTWLIDFLVVVPYHAVVDVVIRQKHRSVVLSHLSDSVVGAGAYVVGSGMIFVLFTMTFFTGSIVGLQGYTGLEEIGAEQFTGLVGAAANIRELTPVIAATALAAQVGTSFTANIGAMRISDEIDALEAMGVRPLTYLVSTRLVATLVAIVPLYALGLFASFLATRIMSVNVLGMSPGVYDHYFSLYLPPLDIFYSLVKIIIFTVLIVLIHCSFGYKVHGGPDEVGSAVGRAMRVSMVTIVVVNLLLSFAFWGAGGTVSLTG